ncbi:MAG: DUF2798 domain-containing protein [Pseudodonghicola sp.]
MMDKKTLLVAQLMITLLMAGSMSGIMSAVGMGLTHDWLSSWPKQFLIAWPTAFVMTQIFSRVGFAIAFRIVPRRG